MLAHEKIPEVCDGREPHREVVERGRHVRLVLAERLLRDRERATEHRLGLGELFVVFEQRREVVERARHVDPAALARIYTEAADMATFKFGAEHDGVLRCRKGQGGLGVGMLADLGEECRA